MGSISSRRFVVLLTALLMPALLVGAVGAQGIQTSPYSAPSMLRGLSGQGFDLAPSNLLGSPGNSLLDAKSSETLPISSGMFQGILPPIPNLQFGYLYNFGNNIRSGRATVDYLLPISLSKDSVLFGEAHTEFQSFWKTNNGFNNRVDMSFGGGYRTILRSSVLLGANGFYDASRLGEKWYSSGGLGLQMAALIPGGDAVDLNFNWYGKLFNSNVIRNAFRFGPSNYDFQAGYSHELWNGGPDLRLSATGYMFDIGANVYGWNGGAELKSRDGMFVLKYDVGHDKVNQTYQTVGGFVNVGFQLENVFKGESPFTMPEPIFKSPRSLRYMLTEKVKRDWRQPSTVVVNRNHNASLSGSGSNVIRFISGNITMVPAGPFWINGSLPFTSFPPVDTGSLDPTGHIVVDLEFTATKAGLQTILIQAIVFDTTFTIENDGFNFPVPLNAGSTSIPLTVGGNPTVGQSAFIGPPAAQPTNILILFQSSDINPITSATVSNVIIRFNQP
jgi:hypothetical protein